MDYREAYALLDECYEAVLDAWAEGRKQSEVVGRVFGDRVPAGRAAIYYRRWLAALPRGKQAEVWEARRWGAEAVVERAQEVLESAGSDRDEIARAAKLSAYHRWRAGRLDPESYESKGAPLVAVDLGNVFMQALQAGRDRALATPLQLSPVEEVDVDEDG